MKYRKQAFSALTFTVKNNLKPFLTTLFAAALGIVLGILLQNPDNEPDELVYKSLVFRYGFYMLAAYAVVFFVKAYCFKGNGIAGFVGVAVVFTVWGRALFKLLKFGGFWGIINAFLLYLPLALFSAAVLAYASVKAGECCCLDFKRTIKEVGSCWLTNLAAIILLNLVFELIFDVILF